MRRIAMFAMILFLMASASAALADPMDGFKWKRFEVAEKRVGIEGFAFVLKSNIIQAYLEAFSYTLGCCGDDLDKKKIRAQIPKSDDIEYLVRSINKFYAIDKYLDVPVVCAIAVVGMRENGIPQKVIDETIRKFKDLSSEMY